MSPENVDSALAFADAFNRRDWNAFLALADEEIKVESRLVAMEGSYESHEGLRRWWRHCPWALLLANASGLRSHRRSAAGKDA